MSYTPVGAVPRSPLTTATTGTVKTGVCYSTKTTTRPTWALPTTGPDMVTNVPSTQTTPSTLIALTAFQTATAAHTTTRRTTTSRRSNGGPVLYNVFELSLFSTLTFKSYNVSLWPYFAATYYTGSESAAHTPLTTPAYHVRFVGITPTTARKTPGRHRPKTRYPTSNLANHAGWPFSTP